MATNSALAAKVETPKAWDAVYQIISPTGNSTMHQISDGKGHIRTEQSQSGHTTTTILDFPGKVMTVIMPEQKMYMKNQMTDADVANANVTKQKPTGKELGAKVIDGHPCHGYESSTGKIVSRAWIGDDIQNLVRSETTTPQGNTTMALKSYSGSAPNQDLTVVPLGYKEMKMPTMPTMPKAK
jgi:hypothetical protein